ncbi:vacuolar ATPase assembly integral membrane protein VMA21 homolog [Plutella xylostella]|uniref:vacuolar ATPase assembly integral membrane protein VMA21 homolog n=1 Tax=Plutella xylostella TaxID=51655 RepID=UPI0020329347|nr:vacuolar ATPase assembly integral membrane protein VMA21 homolog [Plutella xylostella]
MMIDGRANELPDLQVFRTVIKYCLFIIIVPVFSFFTAKTVVFDGILRLEAIPSSVYSAVVAVLVLHITLGVYIFKAYTEAEKPTKPVKID